MIQQLQYRCGRRQRVVIRKCNPILHQRLTCNVPNGSLNIPANNTSLMSTKPVPNDVVHDRRGARLLIDPVNERSHSSTRSDGVCDYCPVVYRACSEAPVYDDDVHIFSSKEYWKLSKKSYNHNLRF